MKIIDFHSHFYPDSIAARTIALLESKSGLTAPLDGTRADLLRGMKEGGVDISVVLPVATKPEQVRKINTRNADANRKDGLVFAGAMHPGCEDIEAELDYIKEAGFFGIKLHPDYQDTFFDDPKYLRVMEGAAKRGLITVTHAGVDVGYPGAPVRCTPDMVKNVLSALKGVIDNKLVLAHMGGAELPGEVLEKLAGEPVYMDTSFVLDLYPEKCLDIIRKHGADRIVFGTDAPWKTQASFVSLLKSLPLSGGELEKIFHLNAESLLLIH